MIEMKMIPTDIILLFLGLSFIWLVFSVTKHIIWWKRRRQEIQRATSTVMQLPEGFSVRVRRKESAPSAQQIIEALNNKGM